MINVVCVVALAKKRINTREKGQGHPRDIVPDLLPEEKVV
jgi:hypothetical protein